MTIVQNPNVLFVLMWFAGCLVTAGLMEAFKAFGKRPAWVWRVLSAVLICITTASAWFGIDGHAGNMWLLPLWLIGGWYLQLVIDMQVIKKIVQAVVKAVLKKKGVSDVE
jgi:hypothetical protein